MQKPSLRSPLGITLLASEVQHALIPSGLRQEILKGSGGEIEKRQATVADEVGIVCPNLVLARLVPHQIDRGQRDGQSRPGCFLSRSQ